MSDPREVIFLLGAGASVDAGMPTVRELTKELRGRLPDLCDVNGIRSPEFGQIFDLLAEKDPSVAGNYERFFEWIKLLLDVHKDPFRRIVKIDEVGLSPDLMNKMVSIPFVIGDEIARLLESYPTTPDYFSRFGEFLPKSGRLKIFSLNYDCCLEDACRDTEIEVTTGFDSTTKQWEPSLFRARGRGINLYKLHGSLRWYEMEPYMGKSQTENVPRACTILELHREEIARKTGRPPGCFKPELVLGPADKRQSDDPFLTLLCEFHNALHEAELCLVVGYGYRDEHINKMLEQALKAGLHVLDVNPSSTRGRFASEERYRRVQMKAKEAMESGVLKSRLQNLVESGGQRS